MHNKKHLLAGFAGLVAQVESLPLVAKRLALTGCFARDFMLGMNLAFEPQEAGMHVEGLFESMLAESIIGVNQ